MFRRCRSKSQGHTLMEFYAGVQALIKRTKLFIPDAIEQAIDEVGLGNVGAIYLASAVNDGDSFDTAYLDAPLPRKGLLTLANGKPLSAATMRMVPADALAFVGFRCDMAKAFDIVWGGFEMAAGEEMVAEAREALSEIQDEIGLDIRDDILGALGEEMVIYGAMPRELRLPKIVASIGVRDRAKAAKLIDLLMNQMPVRLTRMKHGQHVINMIQPSDGMALVTASTCFALLEDRLLISVTRTGLEQALDRINDQSVGGIGASVNFRETMRGMPSEHASTMWWIDTKRALALAYEAAYDLAPAVVGGRVPVDPARMPKPGTFLKHIRSLGGTAYGDEDGLVLQSRTPGLSAILALASRMMMEAPGVPPFAIERIISEMDGRHDGSHPGESEGPRPPASRWRFLLGGVLFRACFFIPTLIEAGISSNIFYSPFIE